MPPCWWLAPIERGFKDAPYLQVGLIISLIGAITLAVRIIGDERMQVDEVEGYKDYQKKVRYRLIQFIW